MQRAISTRLSKTISLPLRRKKRLNRFELQISIVSLTLAERDAQTRIVKHSGTPFPTMGNSQNRRSELSDGLSPVGQPFTIFSKTLSPPSFCARKLMAGLVPERDPGLTKLLRNLD